MQRSLLKSKTVGVGQLARGRQHKRGGWRGGVSLQHLLAGSNLESRTTGSQKKRASYVGSPRKRADSTRNSSGWISTTSPSRQM